MLEAQPQSREAQRIKNPDGFYPDATVADFQTQRRVLGHAAAPLAQQLLIAINDCNALLAEWRSQQRAPALSAAQRLYYLEAVYSLAYARLLLIQPALLRSDVEGELEEEQRDPERWQSHSEANLARLRGQSPRTTGPKVSLL